MFTRPMKITTPAVVTDETPRDGYGTPIPENPGVEEVLGYWEPTVTREVTVGQQTASASSWAGLPVGTTVTDESTLRLLDTNEQFEVVGRPALKWNPWRQRTEFIRVDLSAVTA